MFRNLLPSLLTSLVMGATGIARADHAPHALGSGTAAGALTTLSASTMPTGKLSLGFQSQLLGFERFSDAKLSGYAAAGVHVHGLGQLFNGSLSLAYGLSDDFTVLASLPYVSRLDQREAGHGHDDGHEHDDAPALPLPLPVTLPNVVDIAAHAVDDLAGEHTHDEAPTIQELGDASGMGDLILLGQYRWFHDPAARQQAALLMGLKAPTGRTDVRDSTGERLETHHQPGSGAWDALLGLAFSRALGKGALDASLLYTHTGDGSQNTQLGQGLGYNLGFTHRLGSKGGVAKAHTEQHDHHAHEHDSQAGLGNVMSALAWDLILELNGEWRDRERQKSHEVENTGSHLLYFSPGVRASQDRWSVGLSLGLPIVKDFNGIQSGPDYRVLFVVGTSL